MMKKQTRIKLFTLCASAALAFTLLTAAVFGAFSDVRDGDYFAEPVAWAIQNHVTDGVSATQFAPNEACTRAQIVGFLWKLEGRPNAQADVLFDDVQPDSWYYDAVRWAVSAHVTDGVSATRFAPDKVCTRAEGAAFLHKYYGRDSVSGALPFSDVTPGDWFYGAVLWGVQRGVVNGVSPVRYDPQGTFTRAHIVTMLYRAETRTPDAPQTAVYLGVEGYGAVTDKASLRHRFQSGERVSTCVIPTDMSACALQNLLQEGGVYRIWSQDGVLRSAETLYGTPLTSVPGVPVRRVHAEAGGAMLTSAPATIGDLAVSAEDAVYLTEAAAPYTPPVTGTPGQISVKNFLKTALMPCGTTLYVYGGGWNWQDTAAGTDAVTIGLSESWLRFFQTHDGSYHYKNPDARRSYYPFGGFNQYGHCGLDCSGFVGWAVYNTVNTGSGGTGFVTSADVQAKALAGSGLGSCSASVGQLRPGDVFSMRGHVWICLGTCADGSILILHSTPSPSRTGSPGGGVQLSAIGANADCEAYRLADRYMAAYYPQWYARYGIKLCPSSYTACVGHFTWSTAYDPDGYRAMRPAEVLRDLFGA